MGIADYVQVKVFGFETAPACGALLAKLVPASCIICPEAPLCVRAQ